MVPFGENTGRRGGALLLILINKFSVGEDDRPQFENFNVATTPVSNKIF